MYMLNFGMLLGPPDLMLHVLQFIIKEIIKNPVAGGVDQAWFNAYVRYYYPQNVKIVGTEWNYLAWFRNVEILEDGCFANLGLYGRLRINILHNAGITTTRDKPWDEQIHNIRRI
jgi:hypothetical protein